MTAVLAGLIGPLGLPELVVILVIVLLLFGSTKIPQIMRGMGQGIGEFKKGIKEGDKEEAKSEPPVEKK